MIYLAYVNADGKMDRKCGDDPLPCGLLVSLVLARAYAEKFVRKCLVAPQGGYILDSGAYTALHDKSITYEWWRETISVAVSRHPFHGSRVFSLDVIGEPEATWANYRRALDEGVNCLPTFHLGSCWSYMDRIVETNPYLVGLGNMVGRSNNLRIRWLDQVFARYYPRRFHLFGVTAPSVVFRYPAWSMDSTNYRSPTRFGTSKSFGRLNTNRLPRCAITAAMRVEIDREIEVGREHSSRWAKELAMLATL